MPEFTDIILRTYFKWRQKIIDGVISNPLHYQSKLLKRIVDHNKKTSYGQSHQFQNITNYNSFRESVPLIQYQDIEDDIKDIMKGKPNVLCHEKIQWFAKSSGTSKSRSKFIPVSRNYLLNGHLKCAWDAASFIYHEDPSAKLFADKTFIMGGSIDSIGDDRFVGDISAIILHHFPKIGRRFYTPDFDIALMHDWDKKIKKMAAITASENVTLFAGVPSWSIVLFKEILNYTGKNNISEVWPNLKSYLHGGVGFGPYENIIKSFIPSEKVVFREVYNASEGYFALQNHRDINGMTLLFDHELFYEFIPYEDYNGVNSNCVTIEKVEANRKYVLVITNSSGLYRYIMDDVIEFISVNPYKIKVRGRTAQYINVFGEELMVANAEHAIAKTCVKHQVQILEYTVAPIFISEQKRGKHEWMVEFIEDPKSIHLFEQDLDINLRQINSDYDAKRSHDLVLEPLSIKIAPKGTFETWLRKKGKYGGQNKIKRLSNDRNFINEIIKLSEEVSTDFSYQ